MSQDRLGPSKVWPLGLPSLASTLLPLLRVHFQIGRTQGGRPRQARPRLGLLRPQFLPISTLNVFIPQTWEQGSFGSCPHDLYSLCGSPQGAGRAEAFLRALVGTPPGPGPTQESGQRSFHPWAVSGRSLEAMAGRVQRPEGPPQFGGSWLGDEQVLVTRVS